MYEANKLPSQDELNEIFLYVDGFLFWKVTRGPKQIAGQMAGNLTGKGYSQVMIKGKSYGQSRVIWAMFNGDIPNKIQIDHKDNNRYNNKIENLRLATNQQNQVYYQEARFNRWSNPSVAEIRATWDA